MPYGFHISPGTHIKNLEDRGMGEGPGEPAEP